MKKLYKILRDNKSCSGGDFDWTPYLPDGDKPGKWTPSTDPDLCASGYHGTDAAHLLDFADGNQLFEIECIDETWDSEGKKFVTSSMQLVRQVEGWSDKSLRLFAVYCARQVEYLLTDERSKNAINVAEKYANSKATKEELAAAWDAAWAAASAAASAAARDAARDAARYAAWYAASAAARYAARDAARYAARYAQYKKLYEMIGI